MNEDKLSHERRARALEWVKWAKAQRLWSDDLLDTIAAALSSQPVMPGDAGTAERHSGMEMMGVDIGAPPSSSDSTQENK